MMKKMSVLFLVLALLVSIAGCAGAGTTTTTPTGSTTGTTGSSQTTTGTSQNPPAEVLKLSVELFDRSNTPQDQGTLENNRWTNWIKEEMLQRGVEVTFFPVPRGEEVAKLNVLMASNTAPDIVFTYDRFLFAKYAMEGGLHDLTEPLSQYGANIRRVFEPEGILDYGVLEGKQYSIVARRSNPNHLVSFIRKDWVDTLGLEMPSNRDELVDVLKAFKEQDPGGIGTDLVIPWGKINGPASTGFENRHPFLLFNVMYSFFKHDVELMYTTPAPLREGFKEFMQFMNQVYKEGLIDREFATATDEIKQQQFNTGRVGFLIEGHWVLQAAGGFDYRVLKENVPEAEMEAIPVFQNADGNYYHTRYPRTGLYIMSPKTAAHPEAAIKYLDWMCEDEVAYTFSFGIEGEHYDLVNDIPVIKDIDHNNKTMNYIMGDLRLMFNGPLPLPAEIEEEITRISNAELGDFAVHSSKIAGTNTVEEVLFNRQIEAESTYMPELTKTYEEYWIKLIMATDFESVWSEFQREIKSRGIDEIKAEYETYYNEFMR